MSTKKLWMVPLELTVVVYAEDESEAMRIAEDEWNDGCQLPEAGYANPITSARNLPGEWDADSLPFGEQDDDEELTIGEILAKASK